MNNDRAYIKQFGKTAHRARKTQKTEIYTKDKKHMGTVLSFWSSYQTIYKYRGIITHNGQVYAKEYYSFDEAEKWLDEQYYILNQHTKFGDWLNATLNELQITQTQMGVDLDLSRATINRWIQGHKLPDLVNFIKLARYVASQKDVDVDALLIDMCTQIQ